MMLEIKNNANIVEGPVNQTFMIIEQGDIRIYSPAQKVLIIFCSVGTAISVLLILYKLAQYCYLVFLARKATSTPLLQDDIQTFSALQDEMRVRLKVQLRKVSHLSTPFTVGIRHPLILIPEYLLLESDNAKSILKHELAHIKHMDLLINSLALLIVAVHWYNPLCYLYFCILQNMNERYSDETVTSQMNTDAKLNYCKLLIEISSQSNNNGFSSLRLAFADNKKKHLKRRIDNIMKKKNVNMLIAIVTGVLFLNIGTCTVFAYKDVQQIQELPSNDTTYDFTADDEFFMDTQLDREALPFDDYFIDEAGNIYDTTLTNSKKDCKNHLYVNGTRKVHQKNEKGCKIDYYHAKRCSKCGKIIIGNLYNTNTWKICPH